MADMNLLRQYVSDLDEEAVLRLMREIADSGGSEAVSAMEACQDGMREVGDRFESGEYFVGDLIFAGEVMSGAMEIIKPFLRAGDAAGKGKMILCTVQGDIHDIGKNIVKSMLEAAGFDVLDLGIDVPPEKILETARNADIRIIALSGVLTLALDSMKAVVGVFEDARLRDQVKIIIGGNPVTEEACKWVGADEWALSPQKTVNVCLGWAKAK
ncbi:MAG: cobalamin-dependent protein [Clostridiales bacterium]|nr:cobalamin-dependent protein [Clostridiales bacterium]